ncbi:unnamed protein product [Caenorhabditis bovis]|uniref:RRM domain-containing protein n=1 Tax=Caenorhabditis bovis TaxID=2654633 RepID=A0A8S1E6W5_9PELO|nr:unnamed protein product [Caenorhabditis bovis]
MTEKVTQPTLMVGDLNLAIDPQLVAHAVFSCGIKVVDARRGFTKDGKRQNLFFEYKSFEEAKIVKRLLNRRNIKIAPGASLHLRFVKQAYDLIGQIVDYRYHFRVEASLFVGKLSPWMTVDDIEDIFSKYPSCIGASIYREETYSKSCFVRFLDLRECYEALEMHGAFIDGRCIQVSISSKDERTVVDYVGQCEKNYPEYIVAPKRVVSQEEYNEIIIRNSQDWFSDLEDSRWSKLVYAYDSKWSYHEQDLIIDKYSMA